MILTAEQTKVADLLEGVTLGHGIGTEAGPCTVAAVNLALTGTLTDKCPDCVCPVLHAWVIPVQDAMPLDTLNSPEWLALVPLLAGSVSTPEVEQARVDRIMEWMWDRLGDEAVLDSVPEVVRPAWDRMLTERTAEAAEAAGDAAEAAGDAAWAAEAAGAEYWSRANPAGLLAELLVMGDAS